MYTTVYPKIRAYIKKNSGTNDDALDIFQDAIVVLCKQIKQDKYNRNEQVDGFLYTVARKLWINKAKTDKRIIHTDELIDNREEQDFSDNIITKEREQIVSVIIDKLGKKCYELLRSSILFDKKPQEICDAMGFATVNSVKTQKYKCKQKLITLMEKNNALKKAFDL